MVELGVCVKSVSCLVATCAAALAISATAEAKVISFEEFHGFTSLVAEGVRDTYQLLCATSALTLTDPLQTLHAGFTGVRYLEIRAEDDRKWFSVDNIVLGGVPEPAIWVSMLLGFGAAGCALRRRRGPAPASR